MKLTQSQSDLISNALKHYAEYLEQDVNANEEELSVYDERIISNLMFQFSEFHLIGENEISHIIEIIRRANNLQEDYAYLAGYRESALTRIAEMLVS